MHDLTHFGGVTQTELLLWNYRQDKWRLAFLFYAKYCTKRMKNRIVYACGKKQVFFWERGMNFAVKP